jgi:hypothetical protein
VPPSAPPHIVRVNKKKQFSSDSLPPPALNQLASLFKSLPWYRDRWSHKKFRRAILQTLHSDAPGGLILLGPNIPVTPPPPFPEHFEPIELGASDQRLKILSGEEPTREELRNRRAAWVVLPGLVLLVLAGIIAAFTRARPPVHILIPILVVFGSFAALATTAIRWVVGLRGRWYLLPAAVAILVRRKKPPLTLLTRFDTCAIIRYVNAGKTVVLALELISPPLTRKMIAITHREAISFLAAWQSPHPPPEPNELSELPA